MKPLTPQELNEWQSLQDLSKHGERLANPLPDIKPVEPEPEDDDLKRIRGGI